MKPVQNYLRKIKKRVLHLFQTNRNRDHENHKKDKILLFIFFTRFVYWKASCHTNIHMESNLDSKVDQSIAVEKKTIDIYEKRYECSCNFQCSIYVVVNCFLKESKFDSLRFSVLILKIKK